MIAFSKSDDNSKFNEYLSSLVPVNIEKEYDNATASDSESDDSDNEEAGLWILWKTATDFIFHISRQYNPSIEKNLLITYLQALVKQRQ